MTGLMSAWQCDGPRRDGLLQSADMRDGPLIAQSLRGTPEAFVEIVRRHEVAIHGYLTRRAGLRAADDLLGEVWVRAFGARHRYDTSHEDARPWLYGIARNVLRAHWRTGQNIDLALPEEVLDPWDEITDRLDSAMRARALVSALRGTPRTGARRASASGMGTADPCRGRDHAQHPARDRPQPAAPRTHHLAPDAGRASRRN